MAVCERNLMAGEIRLSVPILPYEKALFLYKK